MEKTNLKKLIEGIILEQYPDNVFKKYFDRLGDAYGRGQTVNRLMKLFSEYGNNVIGEDEYCNYKHGKDGTCDQCNQCETCACNQLRHEQREVLKEVK